MYHHLLDEWVWMINRMSQFENYFPLGIAKDKAFIGREQDEAWLQKNIEAGIHTLLLAPRRYGKSSLVLHTLKHNHTTFAELDLQLCRSAKSIEKKILRGVEQIIASAVSEKETILTTAKSFFKKNNKQWKIGIKGFVELTIEPERYDDIAENILTGLQFLETVLSHENKKAVIFIDEIQEIIPIESSAEIQGAIRHFAQKAAHVVFIFSGSNRRMLRHMFNDNTMPLYQLCDVITLDKIAEKFYIHYLRKISEITWNTLISDEAITAIIQLSERHPRRIYNLCLYLWRLTNIQKGKPTAESVKLAWKKLISADLRGVRYALSQRNTSQLKVLSYIALQNRSELTSKDTQHATNLSATAIQNALHKLEEDDLIERDDAGIYHIIDPVIRATLTYYEKELMD